MNVLHIKIFHPIFQLKLIQKTKAMKDHHKNIRIVMDWHKEKYVEKKVITEILRMKKVTNSKIVYVKKRVKYI